VGAIRPRYTKNLGASQSQQNNNCDFSPSRYQWWTGQQQSSRPWPWHSTTLRLDLALHMNMTSVKGRELTLEERRIALTQYISPTCGILPDTYEVNH